MVNQENSSQIDLSVAAQGISNFLMLGKAVDHFIEMDVTNTVSPIGEGQPAKKRGLPIMLKELGFGFVDLALALPSHIRESLEENEQWQNSNLRKFIGKTAIHSDDNQPRG